MQITLSQAMASHSNTYYTTGYHLQYYEVNISLITLEIFRRYNIQYQFKSNGHSSLTCCEL